MSRQNKPESVFNRVFYKQWIWFSWKYFLQTVDFYGSYYLDESLFNCWRIYCISCWWCLWSLSSSFHCKSTSKPFKNSQRKLIWKWINYIIRFCWKLFFRRARCCAKISLGKFPSNTTSICCIFQIFQWGLETQKYLCYIWLFETWSNCSALFSN